MAARRRRKTTRRRRRNPPVAANPRRRRRRHSRRRNPIFAARATRRRSTHTRRRRRHSRRRNPSALRIGQIAKDVIYGTGGAILTRVGTSLVEGFVPGAFAGSPFVNPLLQIAVAATVVRYAGKKFLGSSQGDIMMLGGFLSAGLKLADAYLPNIQGQLSSIVRAPVQVAPNAVNPVSGAGLGDVYDVDMIGAGFGDVYDTDMIGAGFGSVPGLY